MVLTCGIYLHLPFCASRCDYCSFVVTTDSSRRAPYFSALERELDLADASGARFDSIYLGGGTPSAAGPATLLRLLDAVRSRFAIEPGAEITLEANPEDVTASARDAWISAGVTRVSVGVQAFSDPELSAVGRRHDAWGARRALEFLAGRELSVSGDLILGLPEQTPGTFRESLRELCETGVDHVSVYLLETEKSKSLEEDRRRRPERYLDEDAQAGLWNEACEILAARGFRHYEISNWALPGRESRHNSKYWERVPTLGFGVSAHELWNGSRRANVSGLAEYVRRVGAGQRPIAFDRPLPPDEEESERVVLGLRLARGVPRRDVEDRIRAAGDPSLAGDYEAWREAGLLEETDGNVALTERGFLVSNEILCRFV